MPQDQLYDTDATSRVKFVGAKYDTRLTNQDGDDD